MATTSTKTDKAYQELEQKIKIQLAQDYEGKRLKLEEMMSILWILGQTTSVLELETFLEVFADSFAVLKHIQLGKRAGEKVNIEAKVRKVVSKLVATDPLRATQLAKDGLRKDITWDELVKKYPELNEE